MEDKIIYWVEECSKEYKLDTALVKEQFLKMNSLNLLHIHELENKEGVVAWTITPHYTGSMTVEEMLIYVKPEYRNNPRHFIRLLRVLEVAGKYWGSIKISSSFAYRDNKLLSLLKKRGYITETVKKEF